MKATIAMWHRPLSVLGLAVSLLISASVQAGEAPAAEAKPPAAVKPHTVSVFAIVNGREISSQEYEAAFVSLVRQRFYHGQVPEADLAKAREEVKQGLVLAQVLLEEARRRGLEADGAKVEASLADYERRYGTNPAWKDNRDEVITALREKLSDKDLLAQLEAQVRNVPELTEAEVRAFYEAKPELFTEPEKLRLSAILLKVDPSSPATAWEATREEAKSIFARLEAGADFSDTARLHSSNFVGASADGDMGYLHRGMLPDAIQEKVDGFIVGKVNPPLEVLEGAVILRLDERIPPRLRDFSDVATRAKELLLRERQDGAWKTLGEALVAKANVKFMQSATPDLSNRSDN